MTTNTERMARGWGLIAEGAMEISLAYSAIEPAVAPAVSGGVPTAPTVSAAGAAPSVSAAPSFDELPPEDFMAEVERVTGGNEIPMKPNVERGLGMCPVHGKSWTVKAGGVGAKGAYAAFYKCSERDESQPKGYCTQKPQQIWRDTHPIREGVVA